VISPDVHLGPGVESVHQQAILDYGVQLLHDALKLGGNIRWQSRHPYTYACHIATSE